MHLGNSKTNVCCYPFATSMKHHLSSSSSSSLGPLLVLYILVALEEQTCLLAVSHPTSKTKVYLELPRESLLGRKD